MNRCLNKNADFHRADWISLLNSAGIRQKTTVTPENCNLYAYAGNNPVRYIDPDGRFIYATINLRIEAAIKYLYSKSQTFRDNYNKLLVEKNALNQKFVIVITTAPDTHTGNVTSNDTPIKDVVEFYTLDRNGKIIKIDQTPTEELFQAVFVNLDLTTIDFKGLNLYEILAEEICHAADCISYGADAWNKKCEDEDKQYKYLDRPREKYAKELAQKILQEVRENENH